MTGSKPTLELGHCDDMRYIAGGLVHHSGYVVVLGKEKRGRVCTTAEGPTTRQDMGIALVGLEAPSESMEDISRTVALVTPSLGVISQYKRGEQHVMSGRNMQERLRTGLANKIQATDIQTHPIHSFRFQLMISRSSGEH
jgi:hypothetical protein